MLLLVLGSLAFYGLHQPEYDHRIHLASALAFGLLFLALQAGASYTLVAHLAVATVMVNIVGVSLTTGGINSTAMVWMTVVTLPSIMMLKRRAALAWAGLGLCINVLMLNLTKKGVLDSLALMHNEVVVWTLLNKALVVCLALAVVYLADHLRTQQTLEIDQSNKALEETHLALLQAQAHKDEFIASVGHELRTPMNAILGLNGILRSELAAQAQDAEVVDHIRRSTEQLLHVVNDILDFSQLQAGHLSLQAVNFDLFQAAQDLLAQHQEKAVAQSLRLILDAAPVTGMWVQGDRHRLLQTLSYLLDNAIKFTAQGYIELRVRNAGLGVRFEVEDTGIGISADRQQQVFDGFEFADLQTNRQYGGTGLGLSICERLVSLQGGEIGVTSVPGTGTTFWFELPWAAVPALEGHLEVNHNENLRNTPFRVLLVDDNPVNLIVERVMLRKFFQQIDIVEAEGGAQALSLLKDQSFDLVLMDMVMPDVDGIEATRTLRQKFPQPVCQLPVLGLTASTNPIDRERCLAAGMNEVLHKPLDEAQVVAQIAQVLHLETKAKS